MNQQNETGFSQEVEQDMYVDPVSPGVRFVNYIVDQIAMLVILFVFTFVWVAVAFSRGQKPEDLIITQDSNQARLISIIVGVSITILYYTLYEGFTKGRTFGKMVTGTIAIKEDGSPFTFKDAFLRSLCRLIPFEALSTLFNYRPWHDTFTKTAVVKKTWY
jgi:uncharacterized RDD family membrane protein YckC